MKEKNNKIGLSTYLKQKKNSIIIYYLLSILSHAFGIYLTILTADYLAQVAIFNFEGAMKILLAIIFITVFDKVLFYLPLIIYNHFCTELSFRIKKDLIQKSFSLSSKTFSNNSTGNFITRITYDANTLIDNIDDIVDTITRLISCLFSIVYITLLNFWVGLIIVVSLIISGIIELINQKMFKKNFINLKKTQDKITGLTNEVIRSEKDIKSLGLEKSLITVSNKTFEENKKQDKKTRLSNILFWNSRNLIIQISILSIALVSMKLLSFNALTLAAFLFIFTNKDSLFSFAYNVGNLSRLITDVKVSKERVFEIYDENKYPCEKFGNVELKDFSGKITFSNVGFGYEEEIESNQDVETKTNRHITTDKETAKKTHKKMVLKNISFKIEPNTTVAFVGKSGSGKTTILNLISKLYDADSGNVFFDKTNIKDISKNSIRTNISLVNQFPYIFDETIKNNLLMAKEDATQKEIIEACKKADLWEFVCGLKHKLNTKVGESGIKLSGGQKQRLAIARALLRKSKVLIFDESTSSLDNFSQQAIKNSIDYLKGTSTIIIVAHRLSTIENADKIFFLNNGKIESVGTFKELYKNNKEFKNMYAFEKAKEKSGN